MSVARLFAACVVIWGSTWIAITFQLGAVEPEASVAWRFLLAAALLFGWCRWRGLRLRFSAREHAWLALQGLLMFSVGYVCVYHAERHIVSGLVAVGYSVTPLLNMLGMRLFFGTRMSWRVAAGAALGIAGITLVFWPEFAHLRAERAAALGAAYTVAAVVISALGNLAAHRNHEAGLPIWQSMAWGMLYGALATLAMALALGKPLGFAPTPSYVASLAYLAVAGSILAFGAYITLIVRVGAARAGYVGVMVPVVALAISSLFEGYRWEAMAIAGVAITVAGNVLILRRPA